MELEFTICFLSYTFQDITESMGHINEKYNSSTDVVILCCSFQVWVQFLARKDEHAFLQAMLFFEYLILIYSI